MQGGIFMKYVLIVGAGKGGTALLNIFYATEKLKVVGVIDKNPHAPGIKLAKKYNIPTDTDWNNLLNKKTDIIVEATGDDSVLEELIRHRSGKAVVIPGMVAYIISELFNEKEALLNRIKLQMKNQNLILDNIRDGMIVVDHEGIVQFVNHSAENIIGKTKLEFEGKYIRNVISNSRLPDVLLDKKKEVNQKLILKNGRQIITTRIPIINDEDDLVGAFAVFKDITEVMNLAEENTDLNEIKTMLEAIIQSSDEAISVVDEKGIGLMINPAYSRITGLKESDIIGEPATADISEGESVHMKVLQNRRPVRDRKSV